MGLSRAQMVTLLLALTAGCSLIQPADMEINPGLLEYESGEKPQIYQYLENGELSIVRISPEAESSLTAPAFGEIVEIAIRNNTNRSLRFRIDCGTILRSPNNKVVDLILSRSLEGETSAGGVWVGKAEVFSLQMKRLCPTKSVAYEIGTLAKGDLRRFSDCFCFYRPKPPESGEKYDLTPVQYAFWRITEGVTLRQMLDYVKQKSTEEEYEQSKKQAQEHGQYTDLLLSECKITAKFLD
ncbi:MAG: hypothetical protein RMM17_09825 [Acidobacteriota bacterium]|nr:hypothetical protein [Blastocatellia bacterium]MDW8412966.1 hypothetical protein [Acidobacteriota bacterium]